MTAADRMYDVGGILLPRPFKPRRLGHFALWHTDLDMARKLYVDALGFRQTDKIVRDGKPAAVFTSHGTDHHSLAAIHASTAEGVRKAHYEKGVFVNQISFQVGTLEEVVRAHDYFAERQIYISRLGRDFPGSNWAVYVLDPDGHRVEFYYGMEQIGWDRRSKPGDAYVQAVRNGFALPQPSEMTEIMQSEASGVALDSGFRPTEELPCDYCVGGVMLPRPFKITKIGPVNLFVADIDASERFYTELLGLTKTEDVQYHGHRCVFLRCGTDHHTIGLFPRGVARRAWAQSRDHADEHRHAGRDLPPAPGRDRVPARTGAAVHRPHPVRPASRHRLRGARGRTRRPLHPALSQHGADRLGRQAAPGRTTAARCARLAADARRVARQLRRPDPAGTARVAIAPHPPA